MVCRICHVHRKDTALNCGCVRRVIDTVIFHTDTVIGHVDAVILRSSSISILSSFISMLSS